MLHNRLRAGAVLAACTIALVVSATALAAHPRRNSKYSGTTSAHKFNGFKPAVTFKTSSDGARILGLMYQTLGCFGSGGPLKPGVNYLAMPASEHKLGTIKIGHDGKFSIKNVKSTYKLKVQGSTQKTVTTTTVSGKFTNAKTATGKITFSQQFSAPNVPKQPPCGPVTVTFKATTK